MHKLRTIVLEDEDEERQSLIKKLKFFTELDIVGEATTLDDSFHLIVEKQPDAAFIDIKLIGGDVFTLFRRLQEHGVHIPYSVVTTGYPQYAQSTLNDHRLFVVQFLAKPFLDDWQSKLRKSVDALMAARMAGSPTIAGSNTAGVPKYIFVNDQGTLLRLDFNKIAYLEVAGSGQTLVVTDTNVHRLDLTLTKFSELLPAEDFQRISRNNVINVARILRVNREVRKVDIEKGSKIKTLDIGPEFYTEFLKSLPMARTPAGKSVVIAKQPGSDNASQTSNMPMKGEESGRWQPEMQKNEKLYHLLPPEESVKSNLTTVLFCHLQDSSRFHQNTVSDNVFRYIEYCFQHFDEIVIKYSLEKIKTFGNCYICVAHLPAPDNPRRVVQAALEMQQFLHGFKSTREAQQLAWFEASMGIHSGMTLPRNAEESRMVPDALDEITQVAVHLERMGKSDRIVISASTYQQVRQYFACRYIESINVGNEVNLEVYSIDAG